MIDIFLGALLLLLVVVIIVLAVKLDGSRADLKEAHEQIDEDEVYIAELRDDLKLMEAALLRRAPSRRAGIIARARA